MRKDLDLAESTEALPHWSGLGQTRPRRPPPLRTYARPVLPSKRTNTGRLDRGSLCEGFRTLAVTNVFTGTAAGVRKPPRDETAGRGTYWAVPRAQLWGFGGGRVTAEVGSEVGSEVG